MRLDHLRATTSECAICAVAVAVRYGRDAGVFRDVARASGDYRGFAVSAVTATDSVVLVDDLVVRFGELEAVAGMSFAVAGGEVFALLGPNGAGKTTTIRVLTTLLEPTSGRALVAGYDVRRQSL